MKSMKSAKASNLSLNGSPGRQRIHLIQNRNSFQNRPADDFQALRAQLVDGILRGVPEDIVVTIIEVNQVGRGHASFYERNVIVTYARQGTCKKVRLIAEPRRGLIDYVFQPGS